MRHEQTWTASPGLCHSTGSPIRHQVARRQRRDKRSAAKRSHDGREVGWVYAAAGEDVQKTRRSSPRRARCQAFTTAAASEFRRRCPYVRPVSSDLPWMSLLPSSTVVPPVARNQAGEACEACAPCHGGCVEAAYSALPRPLNSQGGHPHNLPDFPRTIIKAAAIAGEMRFVFFSRLCWLYGVYSVRFYMGKSYSALVALISRLTCTPWLRRLVLSLISGPSPFNFFSFPPRSYFSTTAKRSFETGQFPVLGRFWILSVWFFSGFSVLRFLFSASRILWFKSEQF
jgi:hypothetical protein